jgi:aminoglycoside/choline kinase family phosphotransferase
MENIISAIKLLWLKFNTTHILRIENIPQSGSDRSYFRIYAESDKTYIATCSNNIKENETFIYFSKHFKQNGAPVPEILIINEDQTIYIQEDFGDLNLLNVLEEKGQTLEVYELFKKSLKALSLSLIHI